MSWDSTLLLPQLIKDPVTLEAQKQTLKDRGNILSEDEHRCFKNVINDCYHSLVVVIGENSSLERAMLDVWKKMSEVLHEASTNVNGLEKKKYLEWCAFSHL